MSLFVAPCPYPTKKEATPLLLTRKTQRDLILQIFLKGDRTLFGTITNQDRSYKVPLRGLPTRLEPSDLMNALSTLEKSSLEWDGTSLTPRLRALGGGGKQSREVAERPRVATPIEQRAIPTQQVSRLASSHFLVQSSPAEKPRYWNIPERNARFVGRESLLLEIKQRLQGEGVTTVNVSGLGGVGKTSIVLESLHRNMDNYALVWWISCDHPLSDFRELGEALRITTPEDKGEHVIEVVRGWLEEHADWAIVFDNMEESSAIAPFSPMSSKRGHIITTSRNPFSRESINIGTFSPDESVELLLRLTDRQKEEKVEDLAKTLGHLALALTQAGAYMEQTKTSFLDYFNLFEQVRKELWEDEKAPEDYPETVGTTWNISVKKIKEELPQALEMLYIAAYLAPENMPRDLFAKAGQSHLALQRWFHKLQQYSFLSVGQKENSYSIHRLVQASTRDRMSKEEQHHYMMSVLLYRLKRGWDDFDDQKPDTWAKARPLVTHVAEWCQHGGNDKELLTQKAIFLGRLGFYYGIVEVNPSLSIKYHTQALEIKKQAFGENDPSVVASMSNVSNAYMDKGDSEQALMWSNKVREYDQKRSKTIPSRTVNLNNLGVIHLAQDNLEEAIRSLTEALAISRATPRNDQSVAASLNNLGLAHLKAGNIPLAQKHLTEALTLCKKTYGANHFHVAEILTALGGVYLEQKSPQRAIDHFKQALQIERAVFGKNHPSIALNLANIGCAYGELKQVTFERDYLKQALVMQEEIYGNEHPAVALTSHNLGYSFFSEGGRDNTYLAAQYFMRAFLIRAKTLPAKHMDMEMSLALFLETRKLSGKEKEMLPDLNPSVYL